MVIFNRGAADTSHQRCLQSASKWMRIFRNLFFFQNSNFLKQFKVYVLFEKRSPLSFAIACSAKKNKSEFIKKLIRRGLVTESTALKDYLFLKFEKHKTQFKIFCKSQV